MDDMNPHPQPTRANPDENPIPSEIFSQDFHLPGELDLPNPSPPVAMPSYEIPDQLSHLEPPPKCYPQFEKPLKNTLSRRHFSPSTGKTPRGEKEAVAELLIILVDCMEELNTRSRESLLRKFFSEIERDDRLEKFIVERLRQSKVKAISDLCENLPSSMQGESSNSDAVSTHEESSESRVSSNDDGVEILEEFSSEYAEIYGTSTTTERSLVETVEDLSQELERFKIRTLDLGGSTSDKDEGKN